MDWSIKDKMVNGLFFCATITSRRRAIPHLCKHDQKCPTLVRRQLSQTHAVLGRAERGGANVKDGSTEYRCVILPPRIQLLIFPERHTSVVFLRWTDELLVQFVMPLIPSR